MGSGFSSVSRVDSYHSRRIPTFRLKNRRTFTLFTSSHARGQPWPHSDVDLLVIIEHGPSRTVIADVDWTSFDTSYTTIEECEQAMERSFIACHSNLELVTLLGDPAWEQRIEATARRLYPRHVCGPEAIYTLQQQVRDEAALIRTAGEANDSVMQARAGSTMVWLAGKICLSRLGIGPVREDQWHELLQRAALPLDAATTFARWHLGTSLPERLEAAFSLAEQTLGEPLPRILLPADRRLSPPPAFEPRAKPDAAEAVEMHRLIKAVGFGKMAKAVWKRDVFCQAWEAGTIVWFAVPACLALGNLGRPELHWWHVALSQVILPFDVDAATLYARALTADSVEARTTAACELGQGTLDALEPIFRNTSFAHTYRRS